VTSQGEQLRCLEGNCVHPMCGGTGMDVCSAICFDLRWDPASCGSCDTACTEEEHCWQGSCASAEVGP
jgi:hypothetical protein